MGPGADLTPHAETMSKKPESAPSHYRITIKGHLDDRWADWFENLTFTHGDDGTTTLSGPIPDDVALRSVLRHLSDLGLSLISVQPIPPNH